MTGEDKHPGEVIWLKSTASTNAELKALAASGVPEWTTIVADSQSGGRGRLGRSWHSDGPWGLWASILLRPAIAPEKAPLLGIMGALAVVHSLKALAGLNAGIKWPNDVELDGFKLCGVLPEAGFGLSGLEWVVLGIGINLSEPPIPIPEELAGKAASVERLSGINIQRPVMLERLLRELRSLYNVYVSDGGTSLLKGARAASVLDGKKITVLTGGISYEAKAIGMDEFGAMVIEDGSGARRRLLSGEVSVRRS
jgi:BirA family biotin operon repressor/biotin-[acetyl-CoA-carboxylase] ligase